MLHILQFRNYNSFGKAIISFIVNKLNISFRV